MIRSPIRMPSGGGEIELTVTAKGGFRGKLIRIDLHELWMQHGSENLPRVIHCLMSKQRAGFVFNADRGASVAHYSGLKLDPNAIFVLGPGSSAHSRTVGPHSWASMSLATEDLSAASRALVGGELTDRPAVRLLHANPAHMDRLMRLHMAARGFAELAPETLAHPEISVALENERSSPAWRTRSLRRLDPDGDTTLQSSTALSKSWPQITIGRFTWLIFAAPSAPQSARFAPAARSTSAWDPFGTFGCAACISRDALFSVLIRQRQPSHR